MNCLNQYTRSESVRIYGILDSKLIEPAEETIQLVLSLIQSKLQMHITQGHISISHRLETFKKGANGPIICKFTPRMHKIKVIQLRRKLKGSGIVIQEDLTPQNQRRLQDVGQPESVKAAWPSNGNIFAKLRNDRIVRVDEDRDPSVLLQLAHTRPQRQLHENMHLSEQPVEMNTDNRPGPSETGSNIDSNIDSDQNSEDSDTSDTDTGTLVGK